jgi:hypothetical protein
VHTVFSQNANSNRRNNSIEFLIVYGTVFVNHFKIREHIGQFYNNLYTKHFSWRPKLDVFSFDSIGRLRPTGWRECLRKRIFLRWWKL